jgi:predicted DNA-binding transcriptional regulator YafY
LHRADFTTLAPLLERLRRATREGESLHLTYRGGNQAEAMVRDVDPYALVHRWGWWYMVGYCHLREALRSFRVDRIQALEPAGVRFTVPPDFDIHAYLAADLQLQPLVRALLCFAPEGAHVARGSKAAWEALEEQSDGSVVVTLVVPDLLWAASAALSFGPIVTVLAPAELRKMVAGWAQAVAGQYAADASAQNDGLIDRAFDTLYRNSAQEDLDGTQDR